MGNITNFPSGVSSYGIPLTGAYYLTGNIYWVKKTTDSDYDVFNAAHTNVYVDGSQAVHNTIQSAINASVANRNDIILVSEGSYNETLAINKAGITIVGLGGRGATYVEPTTAGAEGAQVTAGTDDVTIINLGIASDDTGDYALNLNAAARFRAYGCKIEGASGASTIGVLLDGTATDQTADALFEDCELAWLDKVFIFDDSAYGYPTQIFVKNCRFHNIITNMFGVNTNGLVKDLHVEGCVFGNLEDGTAPTDYILLSDNGNTGVFANNFFATATNATGVLTIGTGLLWVANGTEAGISTARPA